MEGLAHPPDLHPGLLPRGLHHRPDADVVLGHRSHVLPGTAGHRLARGASRRLGRTPTAGSSDSDAAHPIGIAGTAIRAFLSFDTPP